MWLALPSELSHLQHLYLPVTSQLQAFLTDFLETGQAISSPRSQWGLMASYSILSLDYDLEVQETSREFWRRVTQ